MKKIYNYVCHIKTSEPATGAATICGRQNVQYATDIITFITLWRPVRGQKCKAPVCKRCWSMITNGYGSTI